MGEWVSGLVWRQHWMDACVDVWLVDLYLVSTLHSIEQCTEYSTY